MAYVLAEFPDPKSLLAAVRHLRAMGQRDLDTHSPYPLQGAEEALGLRRSIVPLIGLVGGIAGAVTGYCMQWWMNGVDFAINVGNRPPHGPPANIPITFELGVLFASICIVVGLFALSGFPRTYHPIFEVEAFRTASVDALWLSAQVKRDEAQGVMTELTRAGALQVSHVPEEER